MYDDVNDGYCREIENIKMYMYINVNNVSCRRDCVYTYMFMLL